MLKGSNKNDLKTTAINTAQPTVLAVSTSQPSSFRFFKFFSHAISALVMRHQSQDNGIVHVMAQKAPQK